MGLCDSCKGDDHARHSGTYMAGRVGKTNRHDCLCRICLKLPYHASQDPRPSIVPISGQPFDMGKAGYYPLSRYGPNGEPLRAAGEPL